MLPAGYGDRYWLHHSVTGLGSIPWIYIYMLAPQAFGAVVCIACSSYRGAAFFAGEVFFLSGKSLRHRFVAYGLVEYVSMPLIILIDRIDIL